MKSFNKLGIVQLLLLLVSGAATSAGVPEVGAHVGVVSSFAAVFKSLETGPKGEYETSEAYAERLKKLAGGTALFRLAPVELRYDADSKILWATFQPDLVALGGPIEINDRQRAALILSTRDKSEGSYVGVTGMGVRVKVNRDTESQDALVFTSKEVMPFQKLGTPLEPSEAKALRSSLRFYVYCRFATGVVGPARSVKAHSSPEFPSNNDRKFRYRYLYVDQITLVSATHDGTIRAASTIVDTPNERGELDTPWEYPELEGKTGGQ